MNFSEEIFYENYLTSDFHIYKHCYFKTCLLARQNGVENRDNSDKAYFKTESLSLNSYCHFKNRHNGQINLKRIINYCKLVRFSRINPLFLNCSNFSYNLT